MSIYKDGNFWGRGDGFVRVVNELAKLDYELDQKQPSYDYTDYYSPSWRRQISGLCS